jgi:hypothetical protein
MMFGIKAEVSDPQAKTFAFSAQKTMYGGKHIAKGDTIFVFASENEDGPGLIASGVVTSAKAIAKERGIAWQTPRVSITIRRAALAKRRLGRSDLKLFSDWNDGRPETELNFKFYRQATNKTSASRMKRRRSSADSFKPADFDMNTIWPSQALERTPKAFASKRAATRQSGSFPRKTVSEYGGIS